MHDVPIVTVFGGSGFLGRAVVARLARAGYQVRVATRNTLTCTSLRVCGAPGQVVAQAYDPARPETLAPMMAGADAAINCVGMLFEKGRTTFHAAHTELARQIATACKRHQVKRFVHISALGVDRSPAKYAKTKLAGEKAVRDIFPSVTILRPSVLFGPGDQSFTFFARLAQFLPVLPLMGGGKTKLQPVYVGDVAEAVFRAVTGPESLAGATYELGGPETLTLQNMFERLFEATGRKRWFIPLPWGLAKLKAAAMECLPRPLFTRDQVLMLQTDNVVQDGAKTFKDLGITPTALDVVLPTYLDRFRPGGKFAEPQRA